MATSKFRASQNVSVSSSEGLIENAAERFLHMHPSAMGQIAKETLEAGISSNLSAISPEDVSENQLKSKLQPMDKAKNEMNALGLELNNLEIQKFTWL